MQLKTSTEKISRLLASLSIEEKVELLTGFDFWNTVENEKVGLRKMLLSDGPAGVRGEFWDERDNSLNLPSGTSLGSSWSREFAEEYGRTLALEAARKGVDVVLGPTINLHRSPLGGRHFECLSEDPMLTGSLAAAFVASLQNLGKAACPKHFVANDFETDRYNVDVRVDERTLNEVYLRPFEDAVVQAEAWSLMSSYNAINGVTASENALLQDPLRSEWGFDGVVISDWTAVRSIASANAEQDLVMPGPLGPWGDALVQAVKAGEVSEAAIDRKVTRILLMAERVGALGEPNQKPETPKRHNTIAPEGVAFARRAVTEGSVLLKNDGVLPIALTELKRVALIGHNADAARTQGGGSATVMPKVVSSPLRALKSLLDDKLSYSIGAVVQVGIAELPALTLTNPVTGNPGVQVDFIGENGELLYSQERLATSLIWLGATVPLIETKLLRLRTIFTPIESGERLLGYAGVRPTIMKVDGQVFIDEELDAGTDDPFIPLMDPPFTSKPFRFTAGKSVEIEFTVGLENRTGLAETAQSFAFGFAPDLSAGDRNIAEAVAAAKNAELAIVVVGTNAKVESEGFDRKNLDLPGRQNELVEAIVEANPNTIVIVNAGAPVLMPWRNKVRAILVTYFAGQEMGNGLVDMLTGVSEPGGRLPTTWPDQIQDVPVLNCDATQPGNFVTYEEGIHIGYRAWLKSEAKPAYDFGFGLGYTSWSITNLWLPETITAGESIEAIVTLKNTGNRAGKHVVQVYASRLDSAIDRPIRWLVGFKEVFAGPGEIVEARVEIQSREFAHYAGGWKYEAGSFQIHVGSSVNQVEAMGELRIS